ncbi:hypothetical protein MEBOL_000313 [Melittangium boletus DSM 14713]|uniref:Uncharacterized protein n=1 Tax=Melittangium boletus DSM 14713 TaxID=1294270 RepID=A0A286NV08_9BACT|nr:hypothetical protein MEBOL_000313 [Melittangium boletus DSM 14713]
MESIGSTGGVTPVRLGPGHRFREHAATGSRGHLSNPKGPAVFVLENQPEWGAGIVLEDRDGKWVLLFEQGGRRVFNKLLIKGLKPADLSTDDARALDAKLRGRPLKAATAKSTKKGKKSALPAPLYATCEDQVRWFETFFAGGFEGERFIDEERGRSDRKGKNGYKTAAITFAHEQLSPERFETASDEELFAAVKKLIQFTNIVHPMEGAIALGAMKVEDHAPFVAAVKALLHGTGDYNGRFERFVDTLNITDAEGKAKKVTWPLATLLSAMYHPTEHVCVKPTAFEAQAPLVGLSANKSQPVTGAAYVRFREVALATQQRLLDAGHRPRDLMDVYSFIWRSQAEKPARASTPDKA